MTLEGLALEPTVDFALIADSVQASGGKLYVLGGGWDTLWVARFPARHHSLGIGMRLRVPWTYADQEVTVTIDLQNEDGVTAFASGPVGHKLTVRRPPGLPDGSDIGVVRAFTFNNIPFNGPGGMAFVVSVDDVERKRIRFTVRRRERPANDQDHD